MHDPSTTARERAWMQSDRDLLGHLLIETLQGPEMGVVDVAFLQLSPEERERLERIRGAAKRAGREHRIRPEILLGVAWRESRWRPEERNPRTDAAGLMQIMPANRQALGITETWRDPLVNLRAGATILREMGYGRRPHLLVFKDYLGADDEIEDPGGGDDFVDYRNEVLTMATRLFLEGV